MKTSLNGKEVIIEDVDYADVPDFSDAYVLSVDGREPTVEELGSICITKLIMEN